MGGIDGSAARRRRRLENRRLEDRSLSLRTSLVRRLRLAGKRSRCGGLGFGLGGSGGLRTGEGRRRR